MRRWKRGISEVSNLRPEKTVLLDFMDGDPSSRAFTFFHDGEPFPPTLLTAAESPIAKNARSLVRAGFKK
jgi:hypothetical protein